MAAVYTAKVREGMAGFLVRFVMKREYKTVEAV